MHYKNGREAKVGDQIVCRDSNGTAHSGVVVTLVPGSTTCNLRAIAQHLANQASYLNAKDCLHVDDAFPPA